jgi:cyanophycin synthetase
MARPGDLLLVFSDALVRSWKQITKFKPEGALAAQSSAALAGVGTVAGSEARTPAEPSPRPLPTVASEAVGTIEPLSLEGLIRDERGVRFAPETDD